MKRTEELEDALFYAAISYLNDRDDHGYHTYDFAEIGIMHVWYDGRWNRIWYDKPENPPRELWMVIEAGGRWTSG